ncbi:hypothetical protein [Scytonema sp. PCC 10023]|uniref:hypothetical protein n=1 Tax=Scytonema sp. PCC 10023 TaxID=1680591 RepID=UPI0039C657E8
MTQAFLQNPNETETPLALLTRWKWKRFSCNAYQLPNGEFVMSDRQMALPMGQTTKKARIFLQLHQLPSTSIQVANRQVIVAYPLSSVAAYWQYLVEYNLIPPNLYYSINWQDLIASITDINSIKVKIDARPTETVSETRFPASNPIATSVVFKLENKVFLEVLALSNSEYRIRIESGLSLIGLPINWLLQLPWSPRKLKKLEKQGFSGATKQCKIQTQEGIQTVETLSIKDWLIIWEFFACRGNSKAAAILRACAEENIPTRVEKMKLA